MTPRDQARRHFAITSIGCIACMLYGVEGHVPCEKHHLNKFDMPGAKRIGEEATVGLCQWHHVGTCAHSGWQTRCVACYTERGPSWRYHKPRFVLVFGSGVKLLEAQNQQIDIFFSSVVR